RVDIRAVEHRLADDRTLAHDEVEDALRQAGPVQDIDDRPGAAGHEFGWLEDDRVAVAERRCDLPGGDCDWEVPRRDDAHNADSLARDFDTDAGTHGGSGLAGKPQGLASEEIEYL